MNKFFKKFIITALVAVNGVALNACKKDDKSEEDKLVISTQTGKTSFGPGEQVNLIAELNEKVVTEKLVYSIVYGSSLVTLQENTLRIKADATINSEVVVKATYDDTLDSNNLTININEIAATSIVLSADKSGNVVKGEKIGLSCVVLPTNQTGSLQYTITQGSEYAAIVQVGDKIQLNIEDDATIDAVVKVRANIGDVVSNELTFTVVEAVQNVGEIVLSQPQLVFDINATMPSIEATALDTNGKLIRNATFKYEITTGKDYLELNHDGTFVIKGHGQAVVKVTAVGNDEVYDECHISVVVPPREITLPNNLVGKNLVRFAYARELSAGVPDPLDFNFGANRPGFTFSQDYTFEFLVAGVADPDFASYNSATKKITFNKTGVVTIQVKSNSGSKVETVKAFVVEVNDGRNARTLADFKALLENTSVQTVNLLADLEFTLENVPEGIDENATLVNKRAALDANAIRARGSKQLFGNGYKYDFSKMEVLGGAAKIPAIEFGHTELFDVEIHDFTMLGNIKDATKAMYKDSGCRVSISVGFEKKLPEEIGYDATKTAHARKVTIDNLLVDGFFDNLRFIGVNEAYVSNSQFDNGYSTHLSIEQSIVVAHNIEFGISGATCVTMKREQSKTAGVNADQLNSITFTGTLVTNNYHDTETAELSEPVAGMSTGLILTNLLTVPEYGALNPELIGQSGAISVLKGLVFDKNSVFNWIVYIADDISSFFTDANANPPLALSQATNGVYKNHSEAIFANEEKAIYNDLTGLSPTRIIEVNGNLKQAIVMMRPDLNQYINIVPNRLTIVVQNMNTHPAPTV